MEHSCRLALVPCSERACSGGGVQVKDLLVAADVNCKTQRTDTSLHDHPDTTPASKRLSGSELCSVDVQQGKKKEERSHMSSEEDFSTVVQELLKEPATDRSKKVLEAIRARLAAAGSQVTDPREFLLAASQDWDSLFTARDKMRHERAVWAANGLFPDDEEKRNAVISFADFVYGRPS